MDGSSTDTNRFNAGDQRSIDHDINSHPGSEFYDVLMDPVGHYNRLKQLKLDTSRICQLERLVPHRKTWIYCIVSLRSHTYQQG